MNSNNNNYNNNNNDYNNNNNDYNNNNNDTLAYINSLRYLYVIECRACLNTVRKRTDE